MRKVIVLLSGGQDSTTCLYLAKTLFDRVHAIGIAYGQRHAIELDRAKQIADLAGVPFEIVDAPGLGAIGGSALVTKDALLPGGGYPDAAAPGGLPTSFVPTRNLLFLTLAAAVAMREEANDIVTGTCQTDYAGYPDCRREFIDAAERAITFALPSGCGPFRVLTPLMFMTKAETVKLARRLPGCWEALARTMTCYIGTGCGVCPACELRARGFAEAGERDPALA